MRSTTWLFLVAVLGVALAGFVGYNAGVSHGLAQAAVATSGTPLPPYAYGWYRPWGFGFPIFFFLFLWVLLLRGLFWGGPWRRWHHDGGDVPPSFEEWHRRSHQRMQEGTSGRA